VPAPDIEDRLLAAGSNSRPNGRNRCARRVLPHMAREKIGQDLMHPYTLASKRKKGPANRVALLHGQSVLFCRFGRSPLLSLADSSASAFGAGFARGARRGLGLFSGGLAGCLRCVRHLAGPSLSRLGRVVVLVSGLLPGAAVAWAASAFTVVPCCWAVGPYQPVSASAQVGSSGYSAALAAASRS